MLSFKQFLENDEEYASSHRPAGIEEGAPLHDLTFNGVYPKDVYDRYWEYAYDAMDKECMYIALNYRGKPDKKVWIYRAVPKSVRMINPGDWVTLSRNYALQHAREFPGVVLSARVTANNTDGSLSEWGYNGLSPIKGFVSYRSRIKKP